MKYINLRTLIEDGYLQEANRQFFHPLGLAMEVDTQSGVILIQDWRDDTEGVIFADGVLDQAKIANILIERRKREVVRRGRLGNVVQQTNIRPWLKS